MQSLMSQIANLFATQSINSLEISELKVNSGESSDFSNVFDTFIDGHNPANLARYDSQVLPTTYTPVSFQINQLNVTAQPSFDNQSINLNADLLRANIVPSQSLPSNIEALAGKTAESSTLEKSYIAATDIRSNKISLVNSSDSFSASQLRQSNLTNPLQVASRTSDVDKSSIISVQDNVQSNVSNDLQQRYFAKNIINDLIDNSAQTKTPLNQLIENEKAFNISSERTAVNNYSVNIEKVSYSTKIVNQLNDSKLGSLSNEIRNTIKSDYANSVALPANNMQVDDKQKNPNANISSSSANVESLKINEADLMRGDVLNNSDGKNKIVTDVNGPEYLDIKALNSRNPNEYAAIQSKERNQNVSTEFIKDAVDGKANYQPVLNEETKRYDSNNLVRNSLNYSHNNEGITGSEKAFRTSYENTQSVAQLETTNLVGKPVEANVDNKALLNVNSIEKLSSATQVSEFSPLNTKATGIDKVGFQSTSNVDFNNTEELVQQITWARQNNANHVKISLSPEHLGALEINIDKDIDGFNIQFTTQNALAKDAIETFIPRLKDMLEQQGLNLQNANVSQQGNQSQANQHQQNSDDINLTSTSDNDDVHSNEFTSSNPSQASKNYLLEEFA